MKVSWEIKKRIKHLEEIREEFDPETSMAAIVKFDHQISELKWVLEDDHPLPHTQMPFLKE